MMLTDSELKDVLTDLKYLPAQKLEAAQEQAEREDHSLYDTLLKHDYLSEEDLGKVTAYHYQLPYVDLGKINIPDNLLKLLPETMAK